MNAKKKTVCILCDFNWTFFASKLGAPGTKFLSDFIHGMFVHFNQLHQSGKNIMLTCLRGYADVKLPLVVLEMNDGAEVYCMLEKHGDEAALEGEAKTVWDKAQCHLYADNNDGGEAIPLPEAMMSHSNCVLSAVEHPEANPFHSAANELGLTIYHTDVAGFAKHGERAQAITDYIMDMFPD